MPDLQPRTSKRLRLEPPPRPSTPSTSLPGNRELLKRWARGEISATAVQQIASAFHEQGAPGAARLASLGSEGAYGNNCQRDLLRYFGKPAGAPPLTYVGLTTTRGRVLHPFLMPHAFFGEMYAERRPFWNTAIRGAVGTAQKYWETISGSELFKLHPAFRGVTDFASLDNHIPLGLHGDGGSFSHQDSLFVLSFNSLVSGGSGQGFARRF